MMTTLRGGRRPNGTTHHDYGRLTAEHLGRTCFFFFQAPSTTYGVRGRPSRRAVARSPHPTYSTHKSGARGGLAAPRRGATVSRCQPLSTRPKKSRKRAGGDHRASGSCVRITPPPPSFGWVLPSWTLRVPMAARGGGVSTHDIALVRGGRALGGRAALAGCLRRPSTLLKGEPRVV